MTAGFEPECQVCCSIYASLIASLPVCIALCVCVCVCTSEYINIKDVTHVEAHTSFNNVPHT